MKYFRALAHPIDVRHKNSTAAEKLRTIEVTHGSLLIRIDKQKIMSQITQYQTKHFSATEEGNSLVALSRYADRI